MSARPRARRSLRRSVLVATILVSTCVSTAALKASKPTIIRLLYGGKWSHGDQCLGQLDAAGMSGPRCPECRYEYHLERGRCREDPCSSCRAVLEKRASR